MKFKSKGIKLEADFQNRSTLTLRTFNQKLFNTVLLVSTHVTYHIHVFPLVLYIRGAKTKGASSVLGSELYVG